MRMSILILGALLAGSGAVGGPAFAQTPTPPANAGPVQPWGLPPLPQGVGPVEKFVDIGNTPQGKFLEGGAFDDQGNLWFVGIGSGWISYLQPDGKLVPVVNCNPPEDYGQTCEPQGTRWKDGKLYLTTRHRGILTYDPQTKELKTLVYTWRNQLFKGPNDLDFDAEGNLYFTDPWATGPGPNASDRTGAQREARLTLVVDPLRGAAAVGGLRKTLEQIEWILWSMSAGIITVAGWIIFAPTFVGTIAEFFAAFLWGFTVDIGAAKGARTQRLRSSTEADGSSSEARCLKLLSPSTGVRPTIDTHWAHDRRAEIRSAVPIEKQSRRVLQFGSREIECSHLQVMAAAEPHTLETRTWPNFTTDAVIFISDNCVIESP